MSGFNFNFNLENFGMGVMAGWASAYALYRARHAIAAAQESFSLQATTAQQIATNSADRRYTRELVEHINHSHLFGQRIPLKSLLVEPRFIKLPPTAEPRDEDVVRTVFHVVPNIPDHPYFHAPYNIETLSLEGLARGDRSIAILGKPGSGKTTALHAIALWSLGEVDFKPPEDVIQKRLAEEDAQQNDEKRAAEVRDNMQIEEMRKRGEESPDISASRVNFRQFTPVYAHLADVRLTSEYGRRVDPAEPLLRAAQQYVNRVTRQTMARNIYHRMEAGKAILLLDGLEELPENDYLRMTDWLAALREQYSTNFIIVTGNETGYGKLNHLGFAPVFVRPWHDLTMQRFVENWSTAWTQLTGQRRKQELSEDTIANLGEDNRARSIFDVMVKLWGQSHTPEEENFETWIREILSLYLPNQPLGTLLPQLIAAARLQLDNGYITAEGLQAASTGIAPPAAIDMEAMTGGEVQETFDLDDAGDPFALPDEQEDPFAVTNEEEGDEDFLTQLENADEDVDALFEEAPGISEMEEVKDSTFDLPETDEIFDDETEVSSKRDRVSKEFRQFITRLESSGLIRVHRGGRYLFRHYLFASYLGSLSLRDMPAEEVQIRANAPRWQSALSYSAMHMPLDDLVTERLNSEDDILSSKVMQISYWMSYANERADWQKRLLTSLGNMLVAGAQFPLLRERAAAALISTRSKNAGRIFERGLKHPNPDVRRLCCLGIGALQIESAIDPLANLLADPVKDVTLAAALALGAIGTDEALEELTYGITSGEESLRQAIAETFAAIPEEGYPLLYEAITHEDMMLRRAAVFGLRRIHTPWSTLALYQCAHGDKQFYVKAAAESAFNELLFGQTSTGVRAYPKPEDIPWLRDTMMDMGPEAVQTETPEQQLGLLAQGGDSLSQQLSIINIGQLGLVNHVGILYDTLRQQSATLRDAGFRALANIQLQMGEPLPSVL